MPFMACALLPAQSFLPLIIARAVGRSQGFNRLSYSCVFLRPGKRKLDPRLRQSLFQSRSALLLACSSSWSPLVAPTLYRSQRTAGLSCFLKYGLWVCLFPAVGTAPLLFIGSLFWISGSLDLARDSTVSITSRTSCTPEAVPGEAEDGGRRKEGKRAAKA